jgi:cytochrome c oxidase assembly factor CtaG
VAVYIAPPAPDAGELLTRWELELLLLPVLIAAVLYLVGVRRLAERGRPWPRRRTGCFIGGLAVIVIATESGLAAYDRVLFSLHVVQHLLLGMVAPLLLVLGAPVTLTLQAAGRSTQTRLLRLLHSRAFGAVTHPVVAWLLFGGTMIALYFSGLYELSLRNQWVHAAMHLHFVVVGFLFLTYVVGIDPVVRALGYGARLLFVLVVLPFHAFLGVALLGSDRVLAAGWYHHVVRHWGASLLSDQRTGAGVLWAFGELFGLATAVIVLTQWMRHEERVAARHDRSLGSEVVGTHG